MARIFEVVVNVAQIDSVVLADNAGNTRREFRNGGLPPSFWNPARLVGVDDYELYFDLQ